MVGTGKSDLARNPNNGIGRNGSTKRICGLFCPFQELGGAEEGPQADAVAGEFVDAALLPVDDADRRRRPAGRPPAAPRSRLERRAARGDHVLDEADTLAGLEDALEPVRRAVRLGLAADDQERQAAGQRGRGRERDRAELRAGEPVASGSCSLTAARDRGAERAEQVGPRLEAVLVEVVPGAAARAQDEVALEVRRLAQGAAELAGRLTARRARGRSAAGALASGESSAKECIEPSSA